MKNGGVWRRLAGSLLGTRQIYLCGAVSYGLDAIPEEWISKLVNKMMVFNAASDLYKKCNKDNIIDNLDFSSCK